jgi:glycine cleavage system H protein
VNIPEELRYALTHEWVRIDDDGIATVGISDFAQDALGDVVYVDLPEVGRPVTAGEPFAEVESTKSVNDVYAPLTGTVVAVNDALSDRPELVNADPYGEAWFARIEPSGDGFDLEALLDAAAYRAGAAAEEG